MHRFIASIKETGNPENPSYMIVIPKFFFKNGRLDSNKSYIFDVVGEAVDYGKEKKKEDKKSSIEFRLYPGYKRSSKRSQVEKARKSI